MIMFIIYDLIFLVVALVYLPVYLFKQKFHRGFFLRLGQLPKNLGLDRPIWIHAVSVGEVMAISGLVEELRKTYPPKTLVISTVTATGNKIARNISKEDDFVFYLPLDLSFIVKNVINKINPSIFIITETELWPNLITYLHRKNIPLIVVNGRISDNSFKGYRCIRFLIRPILNKINLFCVQTQTDMHRLTSLGVQEFKIRLTGNMKFDTIDYTDFKSDYTDYKIKLGLGLKGKLFVAASTHPGEEKVILMVYKRLLSEFPHLRLLIAPRHPERTPAVEKLVSKCDFQPIRISEFSRIPQGPAKAGGGWMGWSPASPTPIFILDTVGRLLSFYAIADIVFVGGSLVKIGGHNILEPASLGKPIMFGPYMFNFRDIADLFLENQAGILVHNKEELEINIRGLLNNPDKITQLAQCARKLVLQNQGATRRNIEFIKELCYNLTK